jgi:CRISPR-associated protein Csm4
MQIHRIRIAPRSAFGSRALGDTLFGQLCWAARHRFGEKRLEALLEGYTHGRPWAVVSDALPASYFPRPALPGHWYAEVPGEDRKKVKKRAWLPLKALAETPVADWLQHCRPASEVPGATPKAHPQPHNTIHRLNGTTGEGAFTPYTMSQLWYGPDAKAAADARLEVYVVLDETRLAPDELERLFKDMGAFGFGRDASIGLGKFAVESVERCKLPAQPGADAWLTLAPCAPQGLGFDPARSFYRPFTRFGRHGDIGVHFGNPFKTPILLAQTGAVFSPPLDPGKGRTERPFIGQGLGGDGSLSKAIEPTVHQGYAPVVGIRLPQAPGNDREAA